MYSFKNLWDVFLLFIIPIGGGIPAGVLLAKSRGINWPIVMSLYFVSDLLLAITFEPVMLLFIKLGKRISILARITAMMKVMIAKTLEHYGNTSGIFALVMIAFGVDPMTGRAVAVAAGHGFVVGWMIAIAGDMMYFTLIMVSTLWLNNILGNGTWTMFIILGLMIIIPQLLKRVQLKKLK